ncbi:MAG: glycosyltransferase family 4 protein [Acidobacteriaceae bacterium]|nr:glycosyltransferase family 4 protein [Acidobacteriaceae bacterium]
MPKLAYLANIFPSSVEPYVVEEIAELQRRGESVICCSVLRSPEDLEEDLLRFASQTIYIRPLRFSAVMSACWMVIRRCSTLKHFLRRAIQRRRPTERRLRALLHTALGCYYAVLLRNRGVQHIHVHHGYFGSWVAMVAARLLNIPFSITLHGSDLLANAAYLDIKLQSCQFCVTISEFNRRYILGNYPEIDSEKVYVRRMGVDCSQTLRQDARAEDSPLRMLAVGRLHQVKDHAFLVRACHQLETRGSRFVCSIAGEGPERAHLEALIQNLNLQREIRLLGQLSRIELDQQYETADVVVLTSRSEGIPLTLMEAMAREKLVLAPAITGIPELVVDGETGFLFRAGLVDDFIAKVERITSAGCGFGEIRWQAREHVTRHFNRVKNLPAFCELLLANIRDNSDRVSAAA